MKIALVHDDFKSDFRNLAAQSWYNNKNMTAQKNNNLIKAFKRYRQRYIVSSKKPDIRKLFPEILFRTMRLEGEKITKKEAKALFR